MASKANGNCYLCGIELGKTAMKNHLLKAHSDPDGGQECLVLRIEGAENKDYWLYIDVPMDKPLSGVDKFLRKIWLECCGHMSGFFAAGYYEVGKSRKLSEFAVGDKLTHEYDFGSTTETVITIVGETRRKKQRETVRLLARNVKPEFPCMGCGKQATELCLDCMYEADNPFLCDACAQTHEHEEMLPVTNSPRMGECGYCGELDTYEFNPLRLPKKM